MKEFIKVMKTVSEPNRAKILKVLQQRSMCVERLQSILGIARAVGAVSFSIVIGLLMHFFFIKEEEKVASEHQEDFHLCVPGCGHVHLLWDGFWFLLPRLNWRHNDAEYSNLKGDS